MRNREILMMASVLALLRGEVTIRGVAERFGVTEAQVARWKDVFEIAGMLALSDFLSSKQPDAKNTRNPKQAAEGEEPTTFDFSEPTTFDTEPTTETTSPDATTTKEKSTTEETSATEKMTGDRLR